ncbi:hypothetical protein AAC387_Pa11g2015 [Persea americana]
MNKQQPPTPPPLPCADPSPPFRQPHSSPQLLLSLPLSSSLPLSPRWPSPKSLIPLLQEAPNLETIEHALWAIYALSTSTVKALSSSPSAAEFLPQLVELIRQRGSTGLQYISVSLICNLSLADERKRVLGRCMGTLVKMMESPLQKSTVVGMQEVVARALVLLPLVQDVQVHPQPMLGMDEEIQQTNVQELDVWWVESTMIFVVDDMADQRLINRHHDA